MSEIERPLHQDFTPKKPRHRFAKGHPRYGGRKRSGRVKPLDDAKVVAEKLGYNCFEQVIEVIQTGVLETQGSHPRTVEVKERVRLLCEVLPYLQAKPQAIEITGKDGGPIATANLNITELMRDPALVTAAESISLALSSRNSIDS